ncbi:MAG: hypothetical protein Q7N50_11185, partial [Armatimonadota bacterium]|nr:hypothetical protein [Armatimonadota bacterium]
YPADDPKQPTVVDELDSVLEAVGDIPLRLAIPRDRFAEVLPKFKGKRAVLEFSASTEDEAKQLLDEVSRYCDLQR